MKNATRNVQSKVLMCLSALASCILTGPAPAQDGVLAPPPAPPPPPHSPPGPADTATPAPTKLQDLPPPIRLGARAAIVRANLPVASTLVIVPDASSYIAAVGAWTLKSRYPVLIDDGSWASREAIARFARSFQPERIVRFESNEPLPAGDAELRAAVEAAAARAWDAEPAALHEQWKRLGLVPPGVVLAHPTDPAWTGALALAAGRGQPILWLNARPWNAGLSDWLPIEKVDELTAALEAELKNLPWTWDALGDDIDAITVCQNAPLKVTRGDVSQTTTYALTDLLGRPRAVTTLPDQDPAKVRRWAWAGQVVGSESQAAYMAMSALFLSPERAWLFDGYDDSTPWNGWDATAAADVLRKSGIGVLLDDADRHGIEDWRRRAAGRPRGGDPGIERRKDLPPTLLDQRRGVDAALIFVNSSGNADFFDLKPGQGKPDDVPVLRIPAAVNFVHSWSATDLANRDSVAGRWLERGVFAYAGSVYEPYLQAFVPTSLVAQRLLVAAPFGASVRIENATPWKIAVLGDPLFVLARPVPRSAAPPETLAAAPSLADELAASMKAQDFAGAINALRLSGRDEEAARLLAALLAERPAAVTPDVALAGLTSAFLELQPDLFARVYAAALPTILKDPSLAGCKDLFWHATYGRGTQLTALEAELLGQSLRKGCLARDAAEAARAVQRAHGLPAAREVIERALSMSTDTATREEIQRWAP